VVQTTPLDFFGQDFRGKGGEILRRPEFLKETGGDQVYPAVGALGGKDRRHEEFKRIVVNQGDSGVGVNPA
jgi:hypothetical protein